MTPIRILIVDDGAFYREALRSMLSDVQGFEVVGEATNGMQAIQLANTLQPTVVLMDVRMRTGIDGVEATRQLCCQQPACQVMMLTSYDDDEYVFEGLRAGAKGYLLKDADPEEIFRGIRATARGESFLQPTIATKVVAKLNQVSQDVSIVILPEAVPLSKRERDVLRLVANGTSNREIADALHLAEGTIKQCLATINRRLGARDRAHAASIAKDMGVI